MSSTAPCNFPPPSPSLAHRQDALPNFSLRLLNCASQHLSARTWPHARRCTRAQHTVQLQLHRLHEDICASACGRFRHDCSRCLGALTDAVRVCACTAVQRAQSTRRRPTHA
eukprot:5776910-Pleurochrysis_carterae.AAC.4